MTAARLIPPRDRLIVALDAADPAEAERLVAELGDSVTFYKIGMELAYGGGLGLAAKFAAAGKQVFVDLKLHDGVHEILGVGRLNKKHGLDEATFAIVVCDAWQGKGLGKQLLKLLIDIGREENLTRITGTMLPGNAAMRHVCEKIGFRVHLDHTKDEWLAEIDL